MGTIFSLKKNGKKSKKVQRANLICQTIFTQMVCDIEIEGNCVNNKQQKTTLKNFFEENFEFKHQKQQMKQQQQENWFRISCFFAPVQFIYDYHQIEYSNNKKK